MVKIKNFLAEQKLRFDLAITFLTFLNFALLILAASTKLQNMLPLPTWMYLAIGLPLGFLLAYLFGYTLDKIGYLKEYYGHAAKRNPKMVEILQTMKEIKEEIKTLKRK